MADVSAFTSSEGASFSGREDRHRETSFSATELMFIKAFLSTFHSCRMHCNHKRERSLMMSDFRGGGSEMTPKNRTLKGKNWTIGRLGVINRQKYGCINLYVKWELDEFR